MSHKGIISALWQHPKKETGFFFFFFDLLSWKNAVVLTPKIDVTVLAVLQKTAPSQRDSGCGGGRTPGSFLSPPPSREGESARTVS